MHNLTEKKGNLQCLGGIELNFARESTTEQSLGGNVVELVDWAYVAPMKLATNE